MFNDEFRKLVFDAEPYEAADERRGGRTRKPLEVVLAHDAHVAVEACETKNRAERVNEGRGPTELAEVDERVFVDDEGGGDTEGNRVGETVHLDAEFALRVREAGDATVHAVEHHGEEDGDGGRSEVPVHRLDDPVEGGEERRGGEGVGENVNTLGFYGLDAALTEFGERDAVGRVLIRHDDPLFLFGSMSKSLCIVAKRRSFRAY